jgi:hypothetical protein
MTITFRTTQASSEHSAEVGRFNRAITQETTPEQFRKLFEEHCHGNPDYLTSGSDMVGLPPLIHIITTNPRLVDTILDIGGPRLLQITTRLTRQTPLVAAVQSNLAAETRYRMVQRLIERGAPVNQAGLISAFGSTPLEAATILNRQDLIHLLLEKGATLTERPLRGAPPELMPVVPAEHLHEWPEKSRGTEFAHKVQRDIAARKKRLVGAALLAAIRAMHADVILIICDYVYP